MTGVFLGNIQSINVISTLITPVSVAATTAAEQTFSVPGLQVGDVVLLRKPSGQAGLSIPSDRVISNGVLGITYSNTTASPIVPTSETYMLVIFRPQMPGSLTAQY